MHFRKTLVVLSGRIKCFTDVSSSLNYANTTVCPILEKSVEFFFLKTQINPLDYY